MTRAFDREVEALCQPHYASGVGRPRALLPEPVHGYLEGRDSERDIAWRCADSLSRCWQFLKLGPGEAVPPDHSALSRTRARLPREVHAAFMLVLGLLAARGLIKGRRFVVAAAWPDDARRSAPAVP